MARVIGLARRPRRALALTRPPSGVCFELFDTFAKHLGLLGGRVSSYVAPRPTSYRFLAITWSEKRKSKDLYLRHPS